MNKNMKPEEKVALWRARLAKAESAYSDEEAKMDERERLYRGQKDELSPLTENDHTIDGGRHKARHVQNIIAENIEAEVNSSIPKPKVTARRRKDEDKARLIENMIRNELNRLPFETMNDMMERTVPIQGGGFWLVEWDNTKRSHNTVGEVSVKTIHPKQLIPQDGVYTGVEDMDYVILKLPQTKEYIKRRYGVDVHDESEEAPEVRSIDSQDPSDEMVTQYLAYYRADDGKIGLFSWCNDQMLEDLPDYQARHLKRCKACGEPEPIDGGACVKCGKDEFEDRAEEFEEIYIAHPIADGKEIPAAAKAVDEFGREISVPTKIPCYKPDVYPVVLQKNVSVFGRLLGESDVDKIRDQQNTLNRLNKKLLDRMLKAGTKVTLPDNAQLRIDGEEADTWYIGSAADKACIGVYDFSGNLQYEMTYRSAVYNEARNILGITDSFQGRQDSTAASGKAKEISAAQAAGRLESKRIMKDAAFAELFRLIFQFKLAYADEPRPVVYQNEQGQREYTEFNRWDFLECDENGEYWWNDQFLFECDTAAPLANNREQMWNNTTAQLQAGCYGDPSSIDTLILYWTKMKLLHYPGAAETLTYLQDQKKKAQEAAMQQVLTQNPPTEGGGLMAQEGGVDPAMIEQGAERDAARQVMMAAIEKARADAARDAGAAERSSPR